MFWKVAVCSIGRFVIAEVVIWAMARLCNELVGTITTGIMDSDRSQNVKGKGMLWLTAVLSADPIMLSNSSGFMWTLNSNKRGKAMILLDDSR